MAKRRIPQILTGEEVEKLLNVFNERYFTPQRNKTMIRLMLDTGLRLSEMINLKWNNVNLQTGEIKVIEGKGNKDRILWINNKTLELLRIWRKRQTEKVEIAKNIFTTSTGNKLQSKDVRDMVYRYAKKAGIQEETEKHYRNKEGCKLKETYKEKKVSPHTFRHTFATNLLRKSNNLKIVQKALGHSSILTTQIYTHIVDEELENAMKNL